MENETGQPRPVNGGGGVRRQSQRGALAATIATSQELIALTIDRNPASRAIRYESLDSRTKGYAQQERVVASCFSVSLVLPGLENLASAQTVRIIGD